MGFLDNSGDIVLDAVLTDAGRQRLARADGTFKVVEFALGDDEINYGLYDKNNVSGTAYYDLSILQTPVFEAFTNNIASLNSKLLTIPRNDLLFLPVMKVNTLVLASGYASISGKPIFDNSFVVLADQTTETSWGQTNTGKGIFNGYSLNDTNFIQIDQGLDTTAISQATALSADLKETQYTVEIDNRLGLIHKYNDITRATDAVRSFVDDDGVAQYFFSRTDQDYVGDISLNTTTTGTGTNQIIAGPVGTSIKFKIRPSLEAATSNYLFNLLGSSVTVGSNNFKVIKSYVIITGATTGYSVQIPICYVKAV